MPAYKLEKCPVCGYKPIIFHIPKNTKAENSRHPKWIWNYPGRYAIGCDTKFSCQNNINVMRMVYATKDEAIESWNRIAKAVMKK